jgi:hypothetical protein
MPARSALVCALALATVFLADVQAYTYADSDSVPEPWSGWWWPRLDGVDGWHYLWTGGGGIYGDSAGPIYDLDTRYFQRFAGGLRAVGSVVIDNAPTRPRIVSGVTVSETSPRGAPGICVGASSAQTGGTL